MKYIFYILFFIIIHILHFIWNLKVYNYSFKEYIENQEEYDNDNYY